MKELHSAAGALEQALDSAQPTAQLLQGLEQGIAAMAAEIRGKFGNGPVAVTASTAKPPPGLPPASVTRLIDRLQAGDSDCDILGTDCLRELEDTAWAPPLRQAILARIDKHPMRSYPRAARASFNTAKSNRCPSKIMSMFSSNIQDGAHSST
jgi:hypothetical protein